MRAPIPVMARWWRWTWLRASQGAEAPATRAAFGRYVAARTPRAFLTPASGMEAYVAFLRGVAQRHPYDALWAGFHNRTQRRKAGANWFRLPQSHFP